ncbi:MAG: succinylglutamate desuccinylase/aspartoacylase family protein [Saprospiraceae bacterium]|nr:succinylglutamate desuccinylase/aspartoacylase family protein [Saprospiraceae bacterium]
MHIKRNLGSYTQSKPGPLLICLAGLHGNEWAGVNALDLLLKMLEVEPITNPSFTFHGKLVCLLGNLPALRARTRYIDYDLNRIWEPSKFNGNSALSASNAESKQVQMLKEVVDQEIDQFHDGPIVLLDLHTTTAHGGIFTLPTSDPKSLEIAETMHAPVITGVIERLPGTCIQFYTNQNANDIIGLVFEGGQHDDPLSVNRSIAAVINCMGTIGCVDLAHIENRHNQLLVEYSRGLPKVADLLYCHSISKDDNFLMRSGYQNFQKILKGELLASDRHGAIHSQYEGMILMPLYQTQGQDGYFIVKPQSN